MFLLICYLRVVVECWVVWLFVQLLLGPNVKFVRLLIVDYFSNCFSLILFTNNRKSLGSSRYFSPFGQICECPFGQAIANKRRDRLKKLLICWLCEYPFFFLYLFIQLNSTQFDLWFLFKCIHSPKSHNYLCRSLSLAEWKRICVLSFHFHLKYIYIDSCATFYLHCLFNSMKILTRVSIHSMLATQFWLSLYSHYNIYKFTRSSSLQRIGAQTGGLRRINLKFINQKFFR